MSPSLASRVHLAGSANAVFTTMRPSAVSRLSLAIVNTLWEPFRQGITGPDINQYPLKDAIKILARPKVFTCQINGAVGDASLLEDFFITVLCGFDIASVDVRKVSDEPSSASGVFQIIHRRPFLGWKPEEVSPASMEVPFYMRGEGNFSGGQLNHLTLRAPLAETARSNRHVPPHVAALLDSPDAMRMLVTLRRARVKPDIITEKALLSASKKQESWASALGLD